MRSLTVSLVLCGYSIGGMLAPTLSIYLVPEFGWEIVYLVAASTITLYPIPLESTS